MGGTGPHYGLRWASTGDAAKALNAANLTHGALARSNVRRRVSYFAHDNDQRSSKMMFACEQEEGDWFDWFQQQPRHEQQHECYIAVQARDPFTYNSDPPQRH